MKDKVAVFVAEDGITKVIHPAPDMFDATSRTRQLLASQGIEFTNDSEIFDFILGGTFPDQIITLSIIDAANLPNNRDFRDAWTFDHRGKVFGYDVPKAQEIQKEKLRALRKPILKELDVAFMRAQEDGDSKAAEEIIAKKQALRDITSLEMPTDISELKAFIPDILQEEL